MASTSANGSLPPNFILTPQQQSLLFAALNSNKAAGSSANNANSLSPESFNTSPVQTRDSGPQESPYLDNYDYDFGPDSSFDFDFAHDSQARMIGDLPDAAKSESTENENSEKRSHPDDDDEDLQNGTPNGAKRRESTEKVAKKPGRKPLTSEPTSV
jgi:AP-1-like transcription factor